MKPKERKGFHPIQSIRAALSKIGTLNLILIVVGAFFVWFNWQMIQMYRECGSIPETYACAVIAATIGECGICGWIRTNKDRKRERVWEKQDQKEQRDYKNQLRAEENGGNE